MRLQEISMYEEAEIVTLDVQGAMRQRLHDLGFIKGSIITKVLESYAAHICAYRIHGTTIALRNKDAAFILVRKVGNAE